MRPFAAASSAPRTARSIGVNSLWSIANNATAQLLSMGVFLVLARLVSREAFGVMAVALSVMDLLKRISLDAIGSAVNAHAKISDREYSAGFWMCLMAAFLLALVLAIGAPVLSGFFSGGHWAGAFVGVAAVLLLSGLSKVHEVRLMRQMRYKDLAVRSLVSVIIGGAVGVVIAFGGGGVWALLAQQVTIAIVAAGLLWWSAHWRPQLQFDMAATRDLGLQARFLSVNAVLLYLTAESDILFVSAFLGPADAGIYAAAKRMMLAAQLVLANSFSPVVLSTFANQAETEQRARAYVRFLRFGCFLIAPIYALLALAAPDIVAILMGGKWAESADVIRALAPAGFITFINMFATSMLLVERRVHVETVLLTGAAILFLSGAALLAPLGAHYVAAWVSAIVMVMAVARIIYVSSRWGISLGVFAMALSPAIAAVAIAAALFMLQPQLQGWTPFARLAFDAAAGGALYALIAIIAFRSIFFEAWHFALAVLGIKTSSPALGDTAQSCVAASQRRRPQAFFFVETKFDNLGDALLNRELLQLLAQHADVHVGVKRAPETFRTQVVAFFDRALKIDQRSGRSAFLLQVLNRRLRGEACFVFLSPGGWIGEIDGRWNLRTWFHTFLYRVLAASGVKICQFGVSYEDIGPKLSRILRVRNRALKVHRPRDRGSLAELRRIGVEAGEISPDLAFHLYSGNETPPRAGVSFSFRIDQYAGQIGHVKALIKSVLEEVHSEEGVQFVAQVGSDREANAQLSQWTAETLGLKARFIDATQSIDDALAAYRQTGVMVSNRLHALLMAGSVGNRIAAGPMTPHNRKIIDLITEMGCAENLIFATIAGDERKTELRNLRPHFAEAAALRVVLLRDFETLFRDV